MKIEKNNFTTEYDRILYVISRLKGSARNSVQPYVDVILDNEDMPEL
jgi:hypothetical protein